LAKLNSKLLLAPVLAVVLALLIAGAVSLWPHGPSITNNHQATPLPTPYGYTPMPTAAPSAADIYFLPSMIIFPLLFVVILVVILVYFRKEPK
jgi:hypothetical protein